MSGEKRQRLETTEQQVCSDMTENTQESDAPVQTATVSTRPLTDEMRGWNARVTENADWEKYYESQGICKDAAELELMKKTFQAPLPVAVRVNRSAPTHASVLDLCEKLSQLGDARPDKCARLSWSVDGNAWQWNEISRTHVRKDPDFIKLKKWFMDHEAVGTLTRQEAVSMIPPIVLDPQPGDLVLDMCAAPGSKTCQMIEAIQGSGVVVASDVEWKRANMLAHQVQRLSSPSNIVCNEDATMFPTIAAFDRVLCDVPCTGDGTIRKAADIWRRWQLSDGNGIHIRQLQILIRGLNMLKPGGTLVYSTCSLNPIENEAVVAAALSQLSDVVELVPLPELPGLEYREGLRTWKVYNDKTKEEVSCLTAFKELESQGKAGRMRASMFPPTSELVSSQLHNSARFLPHLMNTGGFFVAKFEKKPSAVEPKIVRGDGTRHAEVKPLEPELYENIVSFYGLDRQQMPIERLFFRDVMRKHIYYVSEDASKILRALPSSFKLVSIGVRAFAQVGNWESPCPYRITQEGVEAMKHLMCARITRISRDMFVQLITDRIMKSENFPAFENLPKGGGAVEMEGDCKAAVAVMISPQNIHVYAEKLMTGFLSNILSGVHDPSC
jgi:multisite-specific tRNA:(cytosine-C5)-methyltransferase